MSAPIEMIKGSDRQTVYSDAKADALVADGWQRVRDLPAAKQAELRDRPPSPWAGYDDMTAQEVLERSKGLAPQHITEIVTYESATKGRVGIVNKLLDRQPIAAAPVEEVAPVVTERTVEAVPAKSVEKASSKTSESK